MPNSVHNQWLSNPKIYKYPISCISNTHVLVNNINPLSVPLGAFVQSLQRLQFARECREFVLSGNRITPADRFAVGHEGDYWRMISYDSFMIFTCHGMLLSHFTARETKRIFERSRATFLLNVPWLCFQVRYEWTNSWCWPACTRWWRASITEWPRRWIRSIHTGTTRRCSRKPGVSLSRRSSTSPTTSSCQSCSEKT